LIEAGGLSQRAIAAKLGVSRSTVNNIALGRRGLYGRDGEERVLAAADPIPLPIRCRGCGGRVYPPCVLCRTRAVERRREMLGRALGDRSRSCATPRHVA
jgi:transcriptional regulator with XRE-family HTH domain